MNEFTVWQMKSVENGEARLGSMIVKPMNEFTILQTKPDENRFKHRYGERVSIRLVFQTPSGEVRLNWSRGPYE
jgi:hypothetical protein